MIRLKELSVRGFARLRLLGGRLRNSSRNLVTRVAVLVRWIIATLKSSFEKIAVKVGSVPQWIKIFLKGIWYSHRKLLYSLALILMVGIAVLLLKHFWSLLDRHLLGLEKTVIPEMAIEIGVAITGIIAIAFSLSLFAIQQVAERGTPAILQAYAGDPLLKLIYWLLAVFATVSFALALLKAERNFHTAGAVTALGLLFLSFILLSLYFRRVVKFADPRYTILHMYKRGQRQLEELRVIRNSIDRRAGD